MTHMQKQVVCGRWFRIETTCGTETVDADGFVDVVPAGDLADYLEGKPLDPDDTVSALAGWCSRLSAPGYLDCTAWGGVHATREAAERELDDMYGEDGEE